MKIKDYILYWFTKPRFKYIKVWGQVYLHKRDAREKSEEEVKRIINGNVMSITSGLRTELFKRYLDWKK